MRLLAQVRRAGHGRREPTDWYTLGLGLVILAGFPIQAVIGLAAESAGSSRSTVLPVALGLGAAALVGMVVLVVGMELGPVRVGAAEYSWVLGGPVDRRAELIPRWSGALLAAGGVCAGLTVAGAAVGGADPALFVLFALTGAGLGVTLLGAASVLQGYPTPARQHVRTGALAVGVLVFAGTVVLARADIAVRLPKSLPWLTAPIAVVLAILAVRWARQVLAGLDRLALTAANALTSAAGAAFLFLDPALLGDVLAQRALSTVRVRRSRALPVGRVRALLTADFRRALRNRRALGIFVVALLGPYAAEYLVAVRWVPTVVLLCAVPAVSPFGTGLRQVCRSTSLRRMLGGTDTVLRMIHLVVPLTAALLFTVAALPAVTPIPWAAMAVVPIGVLLNLRLRATAAPMRFGGQVADFGLGPIPVDLMPFLVRGIAPLAIAITLQLRL